MRSHATEEDTDRASVAWMAYLRKIEAEKRLKAREEEQAFDAAFKERHNIESALVLFATNPEAQPQKKRANVALLHQGQHATD